MEGYNEVENDAYDAYDDATAGTAKGREHEVPHHNLQIVRHVEEEEDADKTQLIDMGVFKPTSGNATKRLRMRQKTRGTTRTDKTAEATLKQIATQEFQAEKGKMEIWKQMIMQEVGHELQAIRQVHEEAMDAQRHSFNVEIEMVKERLQQEEKQSALFTNEIKILKTQKQAPVKQTSHQAKTSRQDAPQPTNNNKRVDKRGATHLQVEKAGESAEEAEIALPQSQERNARKSTPNPGAEKYIKSYASVAASKPSQAPEHLWTQVKYKNRKQNLRQVNSAANAEHLGRRILFPRKITGD